MLPGLKEVTCRSMPPPPAAAMARFFSMAVAASSNMVSPRRCLAKAWHMNSTLISPPVRARAGGTLPGRLSR